MAIFLDRVDSFTPSTGFTFEFASWLAVTIDTINESLETIQDALNLLTAQTYTPVQIATLFANGDLTNGVILYDSVNNVYVGMENGALVKFTTTAYP